MKYYDAYRAVFYSQRFEFFDDKIISYWFCHVQGDILWEFFDIENIVDRFGNQIFL